MKIALSCLIAVFLLMFASSVRALEPFALYDDFSSTFINEVKWSGADSHSTGADILESVRQIQRGVLHIVNTTYADMSSNTGDSSGTTILEFTDGDKITAIKATVQVNSIEATGCSGNTTHNTNARARLGGTFFNTGAPTPGSYLNDVFAFIGIQLRSDSTDKPGILEVIGRVVQCNDSNCFSNTKLYEQILGTIKVKKKTDLIIQWDKTNHQFIFQFGSGKSAVSVSFTYTVSDTSPSGADSKRVDVAHRVAKCTAEPRTVAFVDANFDNVFVNQSAAP
jgi:hypothetical protein